MAACCRTTPTFLLSAVFVFIDLFIFFLWKSTGKDVSRTVRSCLYACLGRTQFSTNQSQVIVKLMLAVEQNKGRGDTFKLHRSVFDRFIMYNLTSRFKKYLNSH